MVTNAGQTQPFLKEFLGLIAYSPVLAPFLWHRIMTGRLDKLIAASDALKAEIVERIAETTRAKSVAQISRKPGRCGLAGNADRALTAAIGKRRIQTLKGLAAPSGKFPGIGMDPQPRHRPNPEDRPGDQDQERISPSRPFDRQWHQVNGE